MKKISLTFTLFVALFALIGVKAYAKVDNVLSAVGYWQTIDDHDLKPRAIVKIWELHGVLYGKIIKTYLRPGEKSSDICKECSGKLHNQRIIGMTILSGMTGEDGYYTGGRIVDPKSGSSYHCRMIVAKGGKSMSVRGYIGIPLFGRSQVWLRTKSPAHHPKV